MFACRCFLLGLLCVVSAAETIYVEKGASQNKIQQVIDGASSGDVIHLRDGSYTITKPLAFKSGITFRGSGYTKLSAYSAGNNVQFTLTNLSDVTFRKIDFVGINLQFEGNQDHTKGLNYKVLNCTFKNTNKDKFIQFKYCKNGSVIDSTFVRNKSSFFGRGIGMYMSHGTVIDGNTIEGYLDTGININGGLDKASDADILDKRTYDTVIQNNRIVRTGGNEMDHGMYVIGFQKLTIKNNFVKGWTPTGDGGSLKLRNGHDIQVIGNKFRDSGVLMYVYQNTFPWYLKNVRIKDNDMKISGTNGEEKARGVSYFSDVPNDKAIEKDWFIEDNTIENGCIKLDFPDIDVPEVNGAVRNNTCPIIVVKDGIKKYGNSN